ncbi:hypothetical protein DPMN_007507 [Dreissena polymorpha]|uniref:Uncharacterized protein n=1 Tax=Dreissena polymorpha TaxID=45954 RepID=A0A9D4MTR9_DREPO|nr:hypothetical protein DPMN_007507 [Dreissena polymorpha]
MLLLQVYDLSTGGQFPGSQDGCPREDAACGEAECGNGQCEATGVAGSQLTGTCVCKPGWRTSTSQKCDTGNYRDYFMQKSVGRIGAFILFLT